MDFNDIIHATSLHYDTLPGISTALIAVTHREVRLSHTTATMTNLLCDRSYCTVKSRESSVGIATGY
jgi:hypothetical protein